MKNLIVLLSIFTLMSCSAQTSNENENKDAVVSKEKSKPKIDYKVTKEYDENGNLIKLDSIYTYYYANIDRDEMIHDSIYKRFNKHFNMISPFDNSLFDEFFNEDNYTQEDFFKEDFFRRDYKRNQEMLDKMMQRMDAIKNQFFLKEFPLKDEEKEEEKE